MSVMTAKRVLWRDLGRNNNGRSESNFRILDRTETASSKYDWDPQTT